MYILKYFSDLNYQNRFHQFINYKFYSTIIGILQAEVEYFQMVEKERKARLPPEPERKFSFIHI